MVTYIKPLYIKPFIYKANIYIYTIMVPTEYMYILVKFNKPNFIEKFQNKNSFAGFFTYYF